jgi:hypothetical protein
MKRLTVFWFDIAGISKPTRWLVIAASLLIILGAKISSISVYGSATPFWDQWDAEAIGIYRPYVTGTLRFTDLVVPHNEHRILLPKLVALGLFVASGRWDPLLQMICNAMVHTAAVGVLLIVLTRGLDRGGRLALAFFAALAFALPYGAENTLAGFQLQFYLLILLGPLAVFLLYDAAAWSAQWWIGTVVALLSYFTIAPGALTLPAFVGLRACNFRSAAVVDAASGCARFPPATGRGPDLRHTDDHHTR